jgi:hypothetical protein
MVPLCSDCQVVTRGGFHVGNGINWKGQVFSKMRNHTILNKMTVIIYFEIFMREKHQIEEDCFCAAFFLDAGKTLFV